jgi:DNA uptake protein ComE-like DNA-binding protein
MSKFSNKWIKSYFYFSKKDRNGIIVLVVLILIVFLVNILIDYVPGENKYDYSEFEKALNEWENPEQDNLQKTQSLFAFDPNTISEPSLDSLFLPGYVKRNLLNYRKAGGKIKTVPDFRKIYGMNDSIYRAIKPYIRIPEDQIPENRPVQKREVENKNKNKTEDTVPVYMNSQPLELIVELNSADSTELVKLNGVGPVFASRIIRFRCLLGGFYTKEQLLEVYNFPQETFESIDGNLTVDTSAIDKIRINFAGYSELLRHPYLNKEQVQSIIDHRKNNGALNSVNDLVTLDLIDSVTFNRVRPYLSSR